MTRLVIEGCAIATVDDEPGHRREAAIRTASRIFS